MLQQQCPLIHLCLGSSSLLHTPFTCFQEYVKPLSKHMYASAPGRPELRPANKLIMRPLLDGTRSVPTVLLVLLAFSGELVPVTVRVGLWSCFTS